jgi:polar amino acid transport system substrate-binding protein
MLLLLLALSVVACTPAAPQQPPAQTEGEGAEGTEGTGTEGTPAGDDTSWSYIEDRGYMILGLDASFPPMGFTDQANEIVGFDIDFAQAVAAELGVELRLQPISWDAKFLELTAKNIDLIWNGLTINEERLAESLITRPYLGNRQIVVVTADSSISTKSDLTGLNIGAQAGSTSVDALKAEADLFASVTLVEFPENMTALLDLKNGQLDAVIVDEVVGRYYVNMDASSYKILSEDFGDENYGVAVRKTDAAFLTELQNAIDAVITSGQAAEISVKWFGEDIVKPVS